MSRIYSLPSGLCCLNDHDCIQKSNFIIRGNNIFCQCNIPDVYIPKKKEQNIKFQIFFFFLQVEKKKRKRNKNKFKRKVVTYHDFD